MWWPELSKTEERLLCLVFIVGALVTAGVALAVTGGLAYVLAQGAMRILGQ